ncbi:MAG: hypothetical protein PGN34_21000 [Methylobacterium frigidaeris]
MIGVPIYTAMEKLNLSMAQDGRPYRARLDEFFIKAFATARTSVNQIGIIRTLATENFCLEIPPIAMDILKDSFEVHELSKFQRLNHGNHSFGDPSRIMSYGLSLVSYDDIMKGYLSDLSFFQYLAPGSILVCIQYGASGHELPPHGLEGAAQYFGSQYDSPTAKFLRIERKLNQ